MIVYYNPTNFTITGMSHKINPSNTGPYIITDDPLAEQIFLGKEPVAFYQIEVMDSTNQSGRLVKSMHVTKTNTKPFNITDHHFLIPNKILDIVDFSVIQNIENKTISFKITQNTVDKWVRDYRSSNIILIACIPNDIYQKLWSVHLNPNNIIDTIHYTGRDNICFYTRKLFESYQHVAT